VSQAGGVRILLAVGALRIGLVFSSRGATCYIGFAGSCACMLLPDRGSVVADDVVAVAARGELLWDVVCVQVSASWSCRFTASKPINCRHVSGSCCCLFS